MTTIGSLTQKGASALPIASISETPSEIDTALAPPPAHRPSTLPRRAVRRRRAPAMTLNSRFAIRHVQKKSGRSKPHGGPSYGKFAFIEVQLICARGAVAFASPRQVRFTPNRRHLDALAQSTRWAQEPTFALSVNKKTAQAGGAAYYHPKARPPLTQISWPVTKSDPGPSKYRSVPRRSSAVSSRRMQRCAVSVCRICGCRLS